MGQSWPRDILKAIWLVVIALAVGLGVNAVRTPVLGVAADRGMMSHARAKDLSGLRLIDDWRNKGWDVTPVQVSTQVTEPTTIWPVSIDTLTAKQFFDEGECIFLDARPPDEYEGEHILGALNWPADEFDAYYDVRSTEAPKDSCVVAYCNGGSCDESNHLAQSLVIEGWKEVYLYTEGMDEWKIAGYPVATGPEPKPETDPE